MFTAPSLNTTRSLIGAYQRAFPDARWTVDEMHVSGETVIRRWTGEATHEGELMGLAPTKSRVRVQGIWIHGFEGRTSSRAGTPGTRWACSSNSVRFLPLAGADDLRRFIHGRFDPSPFTVHRSLSTAPRSIRRSLRRKWRSDLSDEGLVRARLAAPIHWRSSAVVVTGSGEMVSPLRGERQ